ncbi:18100_t:CDS:2, partial [Gigaspora rosea]
KEEGTVPLEGIGNTDIEELLSKHFDLYVRDSTKYGGFFKQTQSYLMFPYVEKRKRYDNYREIMQVNQFVRGIGDENAGYGDVNGDKADINSNKDEFDREDSTNSFLESNVPMKYVFYEQEIKVSVP